MPTTIQMVAAGARTAVMGRAVGRLVGVLGDIVAARFLGVLSFGLYSIGWTVFRLAELIGTLGLDMGVIRFGSRHGGAERTQTAILVRNALWGVAASGCLLGGTIYLGAPWLADSVFGKPGLAAVLKYAAAATPLAGLLAVLAASTRLTQDMRYTVLLQDAGQPLLALALIIALLLGGMGLAGVLLSQVTSYAAFVAIGIFVLRGIFRETGETASQGSTPSWTQLMRYSMVASLTGVATTAVFWVDRLLVGYYLPAAQAGLYQAASQISVVFVVVLSGLNRIQIPMLASLFQQGRHADMEEVFRVGTKWGVYLCLPILIVIMLAPANVLSATYGGEFSGGRTILLVLLIGQFANLITGPVGPILVATGNEKTALALSAAGLLLSVVMCTALIPRWGTLGAAVATSAALGLLYLGALLSVRSRLSLWPYDWRFIKGILAALASTAAVAAVTRLDVAHPLSALLIQLCVATVVLVIVLLLAGLDAEDVEMLRQLRKSVRI